jgi:hypothetical protein
VSGASLHAVSCASRSFCAAVGAVGNSVPLAMRWDGMSWTRDSTPPGADESLSGVSCTSAATCTAVGIATLFLGWDGKGWFKQPTSVSSISPTLAAVSCASPSSCIAVGYDFTPPNNSVLAEQWNRETWSRLAIPNPNSDNSLTGVSCTSRIFCTAVGDSDNGNTPLIEQTAAPPTGLAAARVAVTSIRATSLSAGCVTETGVREREARAVTADAVCQHFRLTVNGAIRVDGTLARAARGRVTITVRLPRGRAARTARGFVAVGRWRVSLVLPGVNLDPLPPTYRITIRYHGDDEIGPAGAERRIAVESERAGL